MNPAMNTPNTCPKCGTSLPADAPEGLCPACLMQGGFATDATIRMTPSQKPSASQPAATPLPEELAAYFPQLEILELLGRGGMGAVYKARQKNLDRIVALKILPIEVGAEEHFAERFQREAQALARLNHPNIVTVYEVGESKGLFYFLMEFVDGANLRTLIRSGEMKPEAALALIPTFCDALQYAHDEGVVHRDIKPENVLVDKKGRVKIADFGLAKLLGHESSDHSLTMPGMTLGTPRYMAPEQMDKPETVDHRADIYSLGVVFYEMLTGEIPMGRFAPPSHKVQLDIRFDEIVLHAMERDVELRYQHVSEVKTAVEKVTRNALPSHEPQHAAVPIADPAASVLSGQIKAAGLLMLIAGVAVALYGLIACIYSVVMSFHHASQPGNPGDAATRAMAGAFFMLAQALGGIAVLVGGLSMRQLRFHSYALAMSVVLIVLLPVILVVMGKANQAELVILQHAFGLYAGIKCFRLLRKQEVEKVFEAMSVKPRPASHRLSPQALFLRSMLWLAIVSGAVMFCWFEVQTLFNGPGADDDHTTLRIGAVQPWLVIGDRRSSYAPNFLTASGLGGFGALIAGIALACLQRRRIEKAAIASRLNRAAIGLLLAGIADAFAGLIWIGASVSALVEAMEHGAPLGWLVVKLLLSLGSIAIVYYTIGSALFLLHRNDDGDITFPLVMAALAPPGCIFGLPAAVYALVLLSKPEVKALFPQPAATPDAPPDAKALENSFRREAWWFSRSRGVQQLMSIALGAVLVIALLGFFSFRMQATTTADHSRVVRTLYDFTVGAGDPWFYLFHHKTGTRGGMESGMNIAAGSALFGLAAWFAGIALTRLTREQKRRSTLADAATDTPQQKFFWSAVASVALLIASVAGVIVHEIRNDNNGGLLADAVHEVHPDFTRPGITSLALKKAIADELQLTPEQLEKIDQSLNRAYLDFLKLENEHSEYRSENGHLVKIIKPFPDRSFDLAQRLATELRGIAGKAIIDAPERNAVWKLRLFRHAGEFNVRAELWEKDGNFHREESWERDGKTVMGGKSGDTLNDRPLAFGHYNVDWEAEKDIVHEPQPDDATHSYTLGPDVIPFVIERIRNGELARLMAVREPDTVVKSGNPHAALVTQVGTSLGRACAETELKRHGIPFAKDATPEELVKKLAALLGQSEK